MSDSAQKIIDRIFDARYPAFDGGLFKALAEAGVAAFPIEITDQQLKAGIAALPEAFGESSLSIPQALLLFADADERKERALSFESELSAFPLEERPGEIVRRFLLVASNFNDHLWKLYAEDNHDELRRLELPIQQKRLAAENADEAIKDKYRFFNSATAAADFSLWRKRWPWTLEQAVALSFGKDPDVVNANSLAEALTPRMKSPFAEAFNNRLAIFRAAAARGDVGQSINPSDWAELSLIGDFTLPSELATSSQPAKVRPKEGTRDSTYHKLLLGLAIYHYGYDTMQTTSSGSSAYSRIKDDLKSVGIEMDEGTIKTALLKAIEWADGAGLETKRRALKE